MKHSTLMRHLSTMANLRTRASKTISDLPEYRQMIRFINQLAQGDCKRLPSSSSSSRLPPKELVQRSILAGFITFAAHVESRASAAVGQGFYTIGPCGEELLAPVGCLLREDDAVALHYRHLAIQVSRHLQNGKSLSQIVLDRARAFTVSANDVVTGAGHCALGGGNHDYIVTSTLASQTPPAVGRALGGSLAAALGTPNRAFPKDFVSFVSTGDGSINHAHFLSAVNLAEYAKFRSFKCPTIFAISDNGICISLNGHNWLQEVFAKKLQMPVFIADANDMFDVYDKTKQAIESARQHSQPVTLIFTGIRRRFGHAATDRQAAYLTTAEIEETESWNPLEFVCSQAVDNNLANFDELHEMMLSVWDETKEAFNIAADEPKLEDRAKVISRNSQPLVNVQGKIKNLPSLQARKEVHRKDLHPMRKHMTAIYDEILQKNKNAVYIGEDVEHGGYYLVTDGLVSKHPHRVRDFPPEETCLIGAGIGFAQAGLIPIVEIPYAKYLDCAADMFFEAVMSNWLSNGNQPNGMILRLQGFDKGVFGGNFHTHNSLYLPPGLDVVAFSNGPDYARGLRYAFEQARAGRVVMTVDSTNLLNLRHLHENKDSQWMFPYTEEDEILPWDEVLVYHDEDVKDAEESIAIIAYGNAVLTALQSRRMMKQEQPNIAIDIIDCPLLSAIPDGLRRELSKRYDRVVFADVCKMGQHPFGGFVCELQNEGLLPSNWRCVAAQPTYNPLGNTLTFTSIEDIAKACLN